MRAMVEHNAFKRHGPRVGPQDLTSHGFTSHTPEGVAGHVRVVRWSAALRLVPVVCFLLYLSFTVLLFAFGPWPYPVHNDVLLYVFLVFAHLALCAGYLSAAFGKPRGYSGRLRAPRLVTVSIVANLVLFFPTMLFRTGSLVPNLQASLSDLGAAYYSSRLLRQSQTPVVEYIRALFGPLVFLMLPLTVFYWKRLRRRTRMLALASILANLSIGIAMGVNRDLFMHVFLAVWLYLASHFSRLKKLRLPRLRYVVASLLALAVFFVFFSNAMLTRKSSLSAYYFSPLGIYADLENPIVRPLPYSAKLGVLGVSSYLTQGYYALDLSLAKTFLPMFGVGHSMFTIRQAARVTGLDDLTKRSYPDRIMLEDGWNSYANYTTIYPWIASDVSFPGVVVVMYLIGRMLALTWLDTLRGDNPFAVTMFAQLSILLITVPTVNWVVNSGEGFSAFWALFALWILTRKRYVWGGRRLSA